MSLPDSMVWAERPFPDCNLLVLTGDRPTLVDTGFAAHATETSYLAGEHTPFVHTVVNTHWHSDHVGGNHHFQSGGARIVGSRPDAADLQGRDPGCCVAEYLDQPVPPYGIDTTVGDGDLLDLGEHTWRVVAVPGHTPGHLALWSPDEHVLVVGDTLSTYDVGWVNVMRDGPAGIDDSLDSLHRLRELDARVIVPGHGPLVEEPDAAIAKAIGRMERQQADLDLAVMYGAKRVLAYALMIREGMPVAELDRYLHERDWVRDAAGALEVSVEDFARDLVDSMVTGGAITVSEGRARAAAPTTPVDPAVFDLPWPRDWPAPEGH